MKLRCIETGKTTAIADATDEREIRAAASKLVARTYRGHFAHFGSVCLNNAGQITHAEIARQVGGMTETDGSYVTFEIVA